jgi:iron-sulfur cluster assembly protein
MITLTDLAVEKVNRMLSKRGRGLGIRIGVKTTGCSGLAYVLEYVDCAPMTRDQQVFEQPGFKIWVDGKSIIYIDGITIDWQKKGLNEGFEFINSKEKARCGCGESFTV